MENAFAGERKDVLQCRWNLVNILMTGMGSPAARKRIRNARGCLSAASLDQWRLWAREGTRPRADVLCHLLGSILFAVVHIFVEK